VKNATPHQGGLTTAPAVYRRRQREQLARMAAGAHVPNARRDHPASAPAERKQTGRRYGPAPKELPRPRMQAPAPMRPDVRREVYASTGSALMMTRRQMRQWERTAARDGHDEFRSPSGKGSATPKREASR
jgi:hypothetical protein